MALRETKDRYLLAPSIVRPARPAIDAPAHHGNHHAVNLGINWIYELTDAPVGALQAELQSAVLAGERVTPERLHAIAMQALVILNTLSDHFSATNYASIYAHLKAGVLDVH